MSEKKMVNANLANQVMRVFMEHGFVDGIGSDDSSVREASLDEALGVMVVVSARMSAALLLKNIQSDQDANEVDQLASNISQMFGLNFEMALTGELARALEKVQALAAMAEKQTLTKTGTKPTSH